MPKKITPAEKEKPTRDEVAVKVKTVFKRLKEQMASPEHRAFVAAVESSKGLTCLDELALKTLVGIERQIPPDTDHSEGIRALEYCAFAREAKSEMKANYFLRLAVASWKDWMLWDDSELGGKHRAKQSEVASKGRTFASDESNRRIAEAYWEIKGQHGKVKALAAAKGLSPQAIRDIAKNHAKKRIAK